MEVLRQARHEVVSDWVREQIASGALANHAQLPSEYELCKQFEVSRVTVRHALRTLETEGLIYRRQGIGSFVRPKPVRQPLMQLTDFTEDMAAAGMEATSDVLFFGKEVPSPEVAQWMQIPEGQAAVRLDRIRNGNGAPIAYDQTWLPLIYGQFIEPESLKKRTLFQILESDYGIQVISGRYQIEAVNAPPELAQHLNVPARHPMLHIRRIVQTLGEKPVFVQDRYYNSDAVGYCLILERRSNTGIQVQDFQPVFKAV